MKISAIFRIILFSVALFLLLGVLGMSLGVTTFMTRFSSAQTSGEVAKAPEIEVESWSAPETDSSNFITADPSVIRVLEIEWAAGSITVEPSDSATEILIQESNVDDEKYRMVWRQKGDTLSIQFCKDSIKFPSFGINADAKDLRITFPADWVCYSLEIDAASADVNIQNMAIHELDFDGASGSCNLVNCDVGSLDLDAASGNVTFSGCLDSLDFDGASGDCTLALTNCPRNIDLDGVSGKLDITLPSDCGFSVDTEGLRCDFATDFTTETRNGRYHYGNGSCSIDIDAISGSVRIHDGGYASHNSDADCSGGCSIHSDHH